MPTALAQGASPFDTVVDEPVTFRSGGQDYSPHNYDEKFEGRITLRRALADSEMFRRCACWTRWASECDRSGAEIRALRVRCRRICRWRWAPPI